MSEQLKGLVEKINALESRLSHAEAVVRELVEGIDNGDYLLQLETARTFLAEQQQPGDSASASVGGLTDAEATALPADVLLMCRRRGWSLHWTHRGSYLHLEASELIEAVRGKRSDVLTEAGDVLLVLMSITEYAGVPWPDVLRQARAKCDELMERPHYAGEEYSAVDSTVGAPQDVFPRDERIPCHCFSDEARRLCLDKHRCYGPTVAAVSGESHE